MEKSGTRERIVTAALEALGTRGAEALSVRAAEEAAGVSHGSVRHHFGGLDGLVDALVERLLADDLAAEDASPQAALARLLGPGAVRTRARYELMLVATRRPAVRRSFLAARDTLADRLAGAFGLDHDRALAALAALDGLILDALLRGHTSVAPEAVAALLAGAGPVDSAGSAAGESGTGAAPARIS